MSRLCRLKTKSHGDDGQWAYNEIVSLRKQRDELLTALKKVLPAINDIRDLRAAQAAIASVEGER